MKRVWSVIQDMLLIAIWAFLFGVMARVIWNLVRFGWRVAT